MGLTRGVVANIESGRKSDVTVDQLLAIADVLGVPPVAIALPLDQPFRFVRVRDGRSTRAARAWLAAKLFTGEQLPEDSEIDETTTPATSVAVGRWLRVDRYLDSSAAQDFLERVHRENPEQELPVDLDQHREETAALKREVQQLGVDLTVYRIDD